MHTQASNPKLGFTLDILVVDEDHHVATHVSVTLGLYSHVQPGHDQAVADAFGAALDGGS